MSESDLFNVYFCYTTKNRKKERRERAKEYLCLSSSSFRNEMFFVGDRRFGDQLSVVYGCLRTRRFYEHIV